MFVNQNQTNWCERLHLITFAINTSCSTSTGYTPFFLLHGRQARLPSEAQLSESRFADLDSLLESLYRARALARENIEINQIRNANYYDRGRRENRFKIGDTVVCRKFMRKPGVSPKLTLQYYYGPYQIIDMPTEVNAIIEAKGTGGRVIKEKVHVDKLKPYYPRDESVQVVEIQIPGSESTDNLEVAADIGRAVINVGVPLRNHIELEGGDEQLPITHANDMALDRSVLHNTADGPGVVEPIITHINPAPPINDAAETSSAIELFHSPTPDAHHIPELVVPIPPPSPELETAETPRYTLRQRWPVNYRN
jgi:hypothetical protein